MNNENAKEVLKIEEYLSEGKIKTGDSQIPVTLKTVNTFYTDGSNDCKIIVPRINLKSKKGEK